MTVKKKRKTFVYEKILIAVDVVDELGEFIELELITEEPNRASVLIEEMRSSLGLKEVEPRTYLEMVLSEARSD
jgi:adenylate cyclase class IV